MNQLKEKANKTMGNLPEENFVDEINQEDIFAKNDIKNSSAQI